VRDEGCRITAGQGGPSGLCADGARSGGALSRAGPQEPEGSPSCYRLRPTERSEALATAHRAGAACADRRCLFGAAVLRVAPQSSGRCSGPGPAGGLARSDLAVAHGVEEVRIDRPRGGSRREKAQSSLKPKNRCSATPTGFKPRLDSECEPSAPSHVFLRSPLLGASPQPRIAGAHDSSPRTHHPIPVTAFLRQPRDLAQEASTSESWA